jgi:hypothetical protein
VLDAVENISSQIQTHIAGYKDLHPSQKTTKDGRFDVRVSQLLAEEEEESLDVLFLLFHPQLGLEMGQRGLEISGRSARRKTTLRVHSGLFRDIELTDKQLELLTTLYERKRRTGGLGEEMVVVEEEEVAEERGDGDTTSFEQKKFGYKASAQKLREYAVGATAEVNRLVTANAAAVETAAALSRRLEERDQELAIQLNINMQLRKGTFRASKSRASLADGNFTTPRQQKRALDDITETIDKVAETMVKKIKIVGALVQLYSPMLDDTTDAKVRIANQVIKQLDI